MAGTTGLEPATSAVTGQRSDQLSYVPRLFFNNLGYMSHRIKRFAAFAIFALFYHFAAVDSILGFRGHHVDTTVDTKSGQHNDRIKSTRYVLYFGVQATQVRIDVSRSQCSAEGYCSISCIR